MNDRELSFGCFLVPNAGEPLIETAERVERLGLDYVGVQDHPSQRRFVETWSLMTMILASTTTLRVFRSRRRRSLRELAVRSPIR